MKDGGILCLVPVCTSQRLLCLTGFFYWLVGEGWRREEGIRLNILLTPVPNGNFKSYLFKSLINKANQIGYFRNEQTWF
jgi:hypothetical protein